MNEETEQRTAGYITLPFAVLDGWVGQNAQYLKWWTLLRREASWTDKTVWYNHQQVYLQARQVIVTVNSLVKQWQVSKPTVIHFLQRLEHEKLIERQTDSRKTIITITPLGWADSEVKQEVTPAVKVDHDVDHQTYRQPLPPIYNKEKNIIASGGARTREEEVANHDFDEIISFFNQQMKGKGIQQVAIITSERRQAFERLVSQTGVNKDTLKQAIKNAAESDFLNGKGPKGWVASFDWMMMPQNFQKVLENNYRNKPVTQQVQYGTTDGYQDPRRGVEASRTSSYASGYDRPIKKLAHFLTDGGDNRFMIVLDGSTATGKTTLMTAMRQALRWLTDHRLVSDDVGLRILDATKICTLMDSSRDWNELLSWPSYLGIEDLGCEPAEILRWGNPLYPVRELITERYKLRLPMVVSTNLDSDQLREHLGLRIVSRMNEMAFYIHFENEDFRKLAWYSHHPEAKN